MLCWNLELSFFIHQMPQWLFLSHLFIVCLIINFGDPWNPRVLFLLGLLDLDLNIARLRKLDFLLFFLRLLTLIAHITLILHHLPSLSLYLPLILQRFTILDPVKQSPIIARIKPCHPLPQVVLICLFRCLQPWLVFFFQSLLLDPGVKVPENQRIIRVWFLFRVLQFRKLKVQVRMRWQVLVQGWDVCGLVLVCYFYFYRILSVQLPLIVALRFESWRRRINLECLCFRPLAWSDWRGIVIALNWMPFFLSLVDSLIFCLHQRCQLNFNLLGRVFRLWPTFWINFLNCIMGVHLYKLIVVHCKVAKIKIKLLNG